MTTGSFSFIYLEKTIQLTVDLIHPLYGINWVLLMNISWSNSSMNLHKFIKFQNRTLFNTLILLPLEFTEIAHFVPSLKSVGGSEVDTVPAGIKCESHFCKNRQSTDQTGIFCAPLFVTQQGVVVAVVAVVVVAAGLDDRLMWTLW